MQEKWLIGIDEAGRGPLAGPVAVGVVKVAATFDWELIPGVGDSKTLTPEKREALFRRAVELKQQGELDRAVALVGPEIIDRQGITRAIPIGIARALRRLKLDPHECTVRLDGLLKAPARFAVQETIIGGDGSEPAIGLASILAKVTRDQYMVRLGRRAEYVPYEFASHKGYGTKAHSALINEYGLSTAHRRSYCQKFLPVSKY